MPDFINEGVQDTDIVSRRFTCPQCGASHDRGPVNGVDAYRCLGCDWSGLRPTLDLWARDLRNPARGPLIQAQEWISRHCEQYGIDWDNLNTVARTEVVRLVPCPIRCWRVGAPVDVAVGEKCPECGRPNKYQRLS